MVRLSWLQRLYWRHFSKPVAYRELFQHLLEQPIGSILEIGIGNGDRLKQVLSLVHLHPHVAHLRYAGVDPFESGSPNGAHLRLKDVHRMLAEKSIKAHLIPGDSSTSLPRVAHTVLPSDLIIIDSGWEENSAHGAALAQWLPRLSHATSTVFARQNHEERLRRIQVLQHSVQRAA